MGVGTSAILINETNAFISAIGPLYLRVQGLLVNKVAVEITFGGLSQLDELAAVIIELKTIIAGLTPAARIYIREMLLKMGTVTGGATFGEIIIVETAEFEAFKDLLLHLL